MDIKAYFRNAFRFLTFQSCLQGCQGYMLGGKKKKKNNAENKRRNDAMLNACRRKTVSMEGRKITLGYISNYILSDI